LAREPAHAPRLAVPLAELGEAGVGMGEVGAVLLWPLAGTNRGRLGR
jgi:hypothetical protein